ncbi:cephalosporin hydroxylase family protein [Gellertiella hungarica]|uniref:Cephalosporin hydroxylase n=1 Tax=Gellertiella hungarica TaxID=1572859 RepID=A0A7W6NJP4_9HYPH|nr:cephalosporin hydroxylase family protein [Gellertiella hungarica]MBB4063938.1 cephalosporin hydroxylase [Gellertiella hungarica]MBB4063941.1 cephalosporin hydroxylase [Gellertiella hungarica]
MDPVTEFRQQVARNIEDIGKDAGFQALSNTWLQEATKYFYSYNFSWLGRPVIQMPQDLYATQELIWAVRPDLVIETGIAHGGSLILSASMLALLDYCDAMQSGEPLDVRKAPRRVLGIDIDIREHNRKAIEAHPLGGKISMIQGSSIAPETIAQVKEIARNHKTVMVFLDSNHTHAHVLEELELYAPLTSKGSYCVVFDTMVEDLPNEFWNNRPWGKGDNPKTAVWEYMRRLKEDGRTAADGQPLAFQYDKTIETKLAFTAAPDGFLKRV